jgi:hypothetical protein
LLSVILLALLRGLSSVILEEALSGQTTQISCESLQIVSIFVKAKAFPHLPFASALAVGKPPARKIPATLKCCT